jgi:pimeloyl-ACP methyl ester carboxylesterase
VSSALPETKYAQSGGVNVAYQVVGDGPIDLVHVPGWVSHVEYAWEDPSFSAFLRRLASFSRLIVLDRRGTGLSDRVADLPSLEERMDDVRAVMDAAGSERAVLAGGSEAGPMCMMFAATYPARTSALVLYGTFARALRAPDYPIGLPAAVLEKFVERIGREWGTGRSVEYFAPSLAHDEAFRRSWARFERFAVSPAGIQTLIRMLYETDARHILPAIHVPTLVLHRVGDLVTRVEGGRYIAEHIPGAKYVELPGDDHWPWVGDVDALVDEVEEFLTGVRHGREVDRVLATVMVTDIVGSTERAAREGDRRWRELLERHHAAVRKELARFRGREIDTAGDGFLATFDGPARAIGCGNAVVDALGRLDLPVRVGLHTGECEVMNERMGGIAVHIAARVAAMAAAGEVLVSSTVKDLVAGSGIRFVDRGVHGLKGVPDEWRLFAVSRSAG